MTLFNPVRAAHPTVIKPVKSPKRAPAMLRGWKTAVILPDPQFGFRSIDGELDSFHDERAISVAMQVLAAVVSDTRVDEIVNLGDFLDLPAHSRWDQHPAWQQTTQAAIDAGHRFLASQRATSPRSRIVVLEGNHDKRVYDTVLKFNAASAGLRRAEIPDDWPQLTAPFLLRTDDLQVEWLDGYPARKFWLNNWIKCIHGTIVRSSGSTASAYARSERTSTIFGHIHRIEMQHQTRRVRSGSRTNLAACPGCLCRVDGAVPGFKASTDIYGRSVQSWENWQQGIAVVYYEEGEGSFHVELVPIHDGTCIFRGKTYAASDLT